MKPLALTRRQFAATARAVLAAAQADGDHNRCGPEAGDTNMVPRPWAREEGVFQGGRAGLRIDIEPGNPAFPNGWRLRYYGFWGVNFPGNNTYLLTPGQPLVMKYTVTAFAITKR